jgi:NAD(P)-dependent dehydrogenase (short-subunit alcohol dehydrogenase family)
MAMEKKIMVITGASRGVGSALAAHFISHGNTVCAIVRGREKLDTLKQRIKNGLYTYPCDLRSIDEVKLTFERIYKDHGRIDVLINNAGVFELKPFKEQSIETIDRIVDTNLKGAMYCTHLTIPSMIARKDGRIINVASVPGTWGLAGQVIYCASKYGLVGFGDALAQELKEHGVLLVTLCPGGIDTPLWRSKDNPYPGDMERLMKPRELVDLIAFILDQPKDTLYKKIVFFPTSECRAG